MNYTGIRLKEQLPSGLLLVSMAEGKLTLEGLTGAGRQSGPELLHMALPTTHTPELNTRSLSQQPWKPVPRRPGMWRKWKIWRTHRSDKECWRQLPKEEKLGVPFAEDVGNEAEKEKHLPGSEATWENLKM